MTNYVNTMQVEGSSDVYDIHDERIPEITSADRNKILSVNNSNELEWITNTNEPNNYIKSASVNSSGSTLTLTKKDNTVVTFTPNTTGGGTWGTITGNITNQTDLQTALDGKQNTIPKITLTADQMSSSNPGAFTLTEEQHDILLSANFFILAIDTGSSIYSLEYPMNLIPSADGWRSAIGFSSNDTDTSEDWLYCMIFVFTLNEGDYGYGHFRTICINLPADDEIDIGKTWIYEKEKIEGIGTELFLEQFVLKNPASALPQFVFTKNQLEEIASSGTFHNITDEQKTMLETSDFCEMKEPWYDEQGEIIGYDSYICILTRDGDGLVSGNIFRPIPNDEHETIIGFYSGAICFSLNDSVESDRYGKINILAIPFPQLTWEENETNETTISAATTEDLGKTLVVTGPGVLSWGHDNDETKAGFVEVTANYVEGVPTYYSITNEDYQRIQSVNAEIVKFIFKQGENIKYYITCQKQKNKNADGEWIDTYTSITADTTGYYIRILWLSEIETETSISWEVMEDSAFIELPDNAGGKYLRCNEFSPQVWEWAEVENDSAIWGNITGTLSSQSDLQTALDGKQNVISDLETIRAGAALGATAIQEHQSLDGKQDILTAGTNVTIDNNNVINAATGVAAESTWGYIAGSISAQVDLQTALGDKQDTLVSLPTEEDAGKILCVDSNGTAVWKKVLKTVSNHKLYYYEL